MDRRYRGASFLEGRYLDGGQLASDTAAECGVTSSAVSRWLTRHGIERESRYTDGDWPYEQYVEQGRHRREIAEDCGVTKATTSHWLSRHGIIDGTAFERRASPDMEYCSMACWGRGYRWGHGRFYRISRHARTPKPYDSP